MSDTRKWFITGVSSGFGRELLKAVLARGDQATGTVRQPAQVAEIEALAPGRAHGVVMDVTNKASVARGVQDASDRMDGLDVVINNAAFGVYGPVEEVSETELRAQMETNFFGLFRVTKEVLPLLRARRGALVNFSSMAGFLAFAGSGPYCASKFAVEGLTEALMQEMQPFGVKVMLVEPGGYRTDFFASRSVKFTEDKIDAYANTPAGQVAQSIAQHVGHEMGDPAKGAKLVVDAICSDHPPARLVLGADAIEYIRAKLKSVAQDIDNWEQASIKTAFGA